MKCSVCVRHEMGDPNLVTIWFELPNNRQLFELLGHRETLLDELASLLQPDIFQLRPNEVLTFTLRGSPVSNQTPFGDLSDTVTLRSPKGV